MTKRPIVIGEAGLHVRVNTRSFRRFRNWTLAEMSQSLTESGHPLTAATLGLIENGKRRIDVDDLVAFARVLRVSPLQLMEDFTGLTELPLPMPAAEQVSRRDIEDAERYRKMRAVFGEVE